MADFLTRMTQRTLGLLPVVQPIIASKYGSEAMGADIPGGLPAMDPFPYQAVEESFEDWEEVSERVPPAPVPPSAVPRGVRIPTAPVPGMSPSLASPQEQPSTPKVQQTKPAPIRPHEVQPLRETTGGSLPAPLVPKPQTPSILEPEREMPQGAELPGRRQTPPLPHTKPDPYRVGAGLAPALESPVEHAPALESDSQENQPFSSAPTASTVHTMKPHRGKGKPSSPSDVGTRFIASRTGQPLVPAQSGEIPRIDQKPGVGTRSIASGTGEPLVPKQSGETPQIPQMPGASTQVVPHPSEEETSPLVPGQGQAQPVPYTKQDANPYRVRAGLAPALVSPALIPAALPSALSPTLVPESDLIEPGFPSLYPSVQTSRTGTTTARRISAAQLPESHESPTIRVTIGRIDVRAVPPTPPASPAPTNSNRPRPALSLSDYLKQRKGGQR
ncbi:MAG: hypothetical protein E6I93_09230 [Chloroflexi bacterium]|nr:MAG: hypothetical protein E6I93_09230 [Chloroflexota bacterium]